MTDKQVSQYRCETCENNSCKYIHLKKRIGIARRWNSGELKHIDFTPASFTEEMGCASHSNFPKEIPAATQVNAVLDELLPKSTGENKEGGWMYPLKFLSALEFIIEERGFYSFQCEDIEEILIAFETYCRQNAKQEGDGK